MARHNANWTWCEMRDIVLSQWKSRLLQLFSRKWNFMSLWKTKDKGKLWMSVVVFDRIIKARMYDLRLTAIYSNIDKKKIYIIFISWSKYLIAIPRHYLYLCHEINTRLSTKILHFFLVCIQILFVYGLGYPCTCSAFFFQNVKGVQVYNFFFLTLISFEKESLSHFATRSSGVVSLPIYTLIALWK